MRRRLLPRERIAAAIAYRQPDIVPLRVLPAAGGLHEHGARLVDLIRRCGHDFGPLDDVAIPPQPPLTDFDPDGRYHAIRTDDWGTTWEFRIFGVWGHPIRRPLDDWANLATFRPPAPPGPPTPDQVAACASHRQRFYHLTGWGSIFEKMHSVRRFEDVLIDLAEDNAHINRLGDVLVEHALADVQRAIALGADGINFGDDFGTQTAAIVSPAVWRRFFKPRYATLFEPIRRAGRHISFHSCGQIGELLDDFRELGVDVLWPQLTAFDLPDLARRCRQLGLAVELHPDRGDLMQHATPASIRDYVRRIIDIFDTPAGGSWLYIEIDPGFAWPNVEALFEVAMQLRG